MITPSCAMYMFVSANIWGWLCCWYLLLHIGAPAIWPPPWSVAKAFLTEATTSQLRPRFGSQTLARSWCAVLSQLPVAFSKNHIRRPIMLGEFALFILTHPSVQTITFFLQPIFAFVQIYLCNILQHHIIQHHPNHTANKEDLKQNHKIYQTTKHTQNHSNGIKKSPKKSLEPFLWIS